MRRLLRDTRDTSVCSSAIADPGSSGKVPKELGAYEAGMHMLYYLEHAVYYLLTILSWLWCCTL
jgi:hypothetical protein